MPLPRGALTKDIGMTGLEEYRGYIYDDFLTSWRGQEKVKRVREMLYNSPVIGALRLAIEMTLRSIDWDVTSTEGEDDTRIELINESFAAMNMTLKEHVIQAALMPFYGYGLFTIQYQRINGRWMWRKWKQLGYETIQNWVLDEGGELLGVQQYPHLWPEPIPMERTIHYRFRRAQDNPEGESILRPAWIPWYYVKTIQEIEAIGIERNISGLPKLTPPMGADMSDNSTDSNLAQKIVRNVRNDEQAGVVLPPPVGEGEHQRWQFELISSGGLSKAIDTNMIVSRYEKRILLSALAQFLMLGMDSVGALATFEGGNDFFAMLANALADAIADTIESQAFKRVLALNGMDNKGVKLSHSPAGNVQIDKITESIQKVMSLMNWTPEDEAWLRDILKMPEKSIEELTNLQEKKELEKRENALERQVEQRLRQSVPPSPTIQPPPTRRDDNQSRFNAAMDRFKTAISKQKEPAPNITVNVPASPQPRFDAHVTMPPMTVNLPKPDSHQVTVNVPQQPVPEVQVNVEPTPVSVTAPDVKVEPPQVQVTNQVQTPEVKVTNVIDKPPKRKLRIKRDKRGNITGAEEE